MDGLTLSAASATIEATQRGYMVWVRDGLGRTIAEKYFPMDYKRRGSLSAATAAAYAAAAAYADGIGCKGPIFVTH